jgi:hypothetical protein
MMDETKETKALPQVEQTANIHKNPPVGPTTTKLIPEWRKDRDYENFMPTPNQ